MLLSRLSLEKRTLLPTSCDARAWGRHADVDLVGAPVAQCHFRLRRLAVAQLRRGRCKKICADGPWIRAAGVAGRSHRRHHHLQRIGVRLLRICCGQEFDSLQRQAGDIAEPAALEDARRFAGVNGETVEATRFRIRTQLQRQGFVRTELRDEQRQCAGLRLLQRQVDFDFVRLDAATSRPAVPCRSGSLTMMRSMQATLPACR